MKKKLHIFFILFLISYCSFSQGVGIGTTTPDPSAALDITATNRGLLIPRMNLLSINAIINPARGLLVYDSLANQLMVNTGRPDAPNWQPVAGSSSSGGWSLTGNSGTNPVNQFIGTTDNQPLHFRINNIQVGELHPVTGNIFWGSGAGQENTTGFSNIAIGTDALKSNIVGANLVAIGDSALFNNKENTPFFDEGAFNTAIGSKSLFSNTIGAENTAIGYRTLFNNTTGVRNTVTGSQALFLNTTGSNNTGYGWASLAANSIGNNNTAVGWASLFSNSTASFNTAIGYQSLFSNTTGHDNAAIGYQSLNSNTNGTENTATGSASLFSNTLGSFNTATGFESLNSNTTGSSNTATGMRSLAFNTTGRSNTAVGTETLNLNTTGQLNTAIGSRALLFNETGNSNTGVGFEALRQNTAGQDNTALGQGAMFSNTTGKFNVAIGNEALFFTTTAEENTAVGFNAAKNFNLGFNNTFLGAHSDGNQPGIFNCVAIGQTSRCTASNQVRFGNSSTTSIGGIVGYTNLSDGRYKKNIREGVKGIDFIMKLKPVTYQLDISGLSKKLNENNGKEMDDLSKKSMAEQEKIIFSGFIAQEVEQAAKDARYDFSGVDKPKNENDMYGLRYAEFVVPLVKAVQEQQQMIEELKKQNEELRKINAGQKSFNNDLLKRIEKLESPFTVKK